MTVQALIESAMREFGQLHPGYTATTTDYNVCLDALNQMLSIWNAEGTIIYSVVQDTLTLTGAISYTFGASGDLNSTRPTRIKAARTEVNSLGFPVKIILAGEWDAQIDRSQTGSYIEFLYCDYAYPQAKIYILPVPSAGTLYLHSYKPVSAFAALSDTIALPSGYEHALRLNLAVLAAPEFGKQCSPEIVQQAPMAKAAIAALNAEVLGTHIPSGGPSK